MRVEKHECQRCECDVDVPMTALYRVTIALVAPIDPAKPEPPIVLDVCYSCAKAIEYFAKAEMIPLDALGLRRHEDLVREVQREKLEEGD